MSLQHNIAFIRKHKKLTYAELGAAISATEGQAKTYELKGTTPPVEMLCDIADFAGITLDVLLREKLTETTYLDFQDPSIGFDIAAQIQQRIGFVLKVMLKERTFGKYTLKDLQRISMLPESRFRKLLDGDPVTVTAEAIINLVEHLHVNANWVLTGNGTMFNDTEMVQGLHKLKERIDLLEEKIKK